MSLTFAKLQQLSHGLNVGVSELFHEDGQAPSVQPSGRARRSVARSDVPSSFSTHHYTYTYLHTDLLRRTMTPFRMVLRARTMRAFRELIRHPGEEFIVVFYGSVVVHTEHYAPTQLGPRPQPLHRQHDGPRLPVGRRSGRHDHLRVRRRRSRQPAGCGRGPIAGIRTERLVQSTSNIARPRGFAAGQGERRGPRKPMPRSIASRRVCPSTWGIKPGKQSWTFYSTASDLPLNFHPAAIRASAVGDTP